MDIYSPFLHKVRLGFISILLIFSGGCATVYVPLEKQNRYPGKIVKKAKIVNPNLHAELAQAEAEHKTSLFLFGLGSVMGGAIGGILMGQHMNGAIGPDNIGEPYRYTINTEDSRVIVIINKHAGFQVGDCVSVLVGEETGEVKMAYGSECKQDS